MKTFTIQLKDIQITAPEHPFDCDFVELLSKRFSASLTQELFVDHNSAKNTLSEIITLFDLPKHDAPSFQNEAFIDVENGTKCCIGEDYIRFVDDTTLIELESKYWSVDEIVEDFSNVMGSILGFICSGQNF